MFITDKLAKHLLDASPDSTVVVDENGIIRYANARMHELLGYECEALIGCAIEALIPARFHATHSKHMDAFLARPRRRQLRAEIELTALHKTGREIPVEISLRPLHTDTGLFVSAVVRDISVHKEIERQLVEANRAKSRFLAAASHDLRQPLQALNLLNRAARKTATNAVHRTIIEKQQKALDSMSSLLNSLLDISKLEAGIVKTEIADFAVRDVFDSLRAEFEPQAQDKGIELVVEGCKDVARSDRRLLTQILENLTANAIRYTREGSVRLRSHRLDRKIRIEVADTGLGIPEAELDRIFEEFHQVDRGDHRPEGLGLGLSIVKRTAQLLGCTLDVDSAPNEGSIFSVTVPQGDAARLRRGIGARTPPLNALGGLILIIDDDTAVVDATRMLLETEGFDVLTADCRDEAILRLNGRTPNLLISDYHLKEHGTGLDIIRAVRNRFEAAVPAILVTGDTSSAVPAAADMEHVTFLTKPVNIDELLSAIRTGIGPPSH